MVQNTPGWTLLPCPSIPRYPLLVGRPLAGPAVQDSGCKAGGAVCSGRNVHARMDRGTKQTSGTSAPLGCPGSTPDLGTHLHRGAAQGYISLLSRLRGGCPCVLLSIWHVPQSQEAFPQRAVSWNAVAPPRELLSLWLLSPISLTGFLLFLFFSVGQVVNIKAKVNRAFNSSMEVGVCPCPCAPSCVPIPTSQTPNSSHSSQL